MRRPAGREVASYVWALSPLLLTFPAAPAFAWAAWKRRSSGLLAEAGCYLAGTVILVAVPEQRWGNTSGFVGLAEMVVATGRALLLRRRVWRLHVAEVTSPVHVPVEVQWHAFAHITGSTCDGHDAHRLSLSNANAAGLVAGGGALLGIGLWIGFHQLQVTGIGLLLGGLLVPLFERTVVGSVVHLRTWGLPRRLDLTHVVRVDVPWMGVTSLRLQTATTRFRGVTISGVGAAPMSREACQHLRGWLDHPGVEISERARNVLRD